MSQCTPLWTGEDLSQARSATELPPDEVRLLVFEVACQWYALALADVDQVLPMARLACPPGGPSFLAGLLDLHGEIVPVVKLSRLFQLADHPPGLYTPLIVLRGHRCAIALQAERIDGIASVQRQQVLAIDRHPSLNDCATGLVHLSQPAILLAAEKILLDQELKRLAEIRDREQQRLSEVEGPAR